MISSLLRRFGGPVIAFALVAAAFTAPAYADTPTSSANPKPDFATTQAGTSVIIKPFLNDEIVYETRFKPVLVTVPANGTIEWVYTDTPGAPTPVPDLQLRYTPNDGFSGVDSFDYRIEVDALFYGPITVTIEVTAPQSQLLLNPDSYTVQAGGPMAEFDVTSNDVIGSPNKVLGIAQLPSHGTAVLLGNGTVGYTADPAYAGQDMFTYTVYVNNDPGTLEEATVSITVLPAPNVDSDSDGVIDALDKCPGTPAGDAVDDDGCTIVVPPTCVNVSLSTATYVYNRNTATVTLKDGKLACADFTFSVARWSFDNAPVSMWPQTAEDTAVAVLKEGTNSATATVSDGCAQFDAYANSGPVKGQKMMGPNTGYAEVFLNTKATGPTPYTVDNPATCAPVLTPVTATTPTSVDACGTANDTYTIPAKAGVVYSVGGNVKAAGTYEGVGSVIVTASATEGNKLEGTSSWTIVFTNVACAPVLTPVTATTPTSVDACGTANDTYTIPAKAGVVYSVGGNVKAAGTYEGVGSVIVTASATEGNKLEGTSSWTIVFTNVACEVVVPVVTPSIITPSAPVAVVVTSPKPVASQKLANTGADTTSLLIAGFLALGSGALVLAGGRRRAH